MTVCDRCGVRCNDTGWTAINRDGRAITLCGHHFTDHRDALVKQGWTVVELANIETEPSKETAGGVHPEV